MKKVTTQVLTDFFGDNIEGYALNVLTPLDFMLQQKEHKRKFEEILKIACLGISFNDFKKAVSEHKEDFEKHKDETKHILATKIETSGKVIATLKDSPARWLFISIYWAYNFRDHSISDIQKKYDPRIGAIALTFILQSNKMKKMETFKGIKPHSDKFYTNLSVRLVRVIEILTAMSNENNSYLNRVYLGDNIHNVASNFLHVLSNNRFEKNTIDVAKTKDGRPIIQYKNSIENIELVIASTRMLKNGFLSVITRTKEEYQQLLLLTPAGDSRSQHKTNRGSRSPRDYYLIPDELIPVVMLDISSILNQEEQIEAINRISYRRDTGVNYGGKNNIKYTPSAQEQNQRNRAFSSTFTKKNLLLSGDYNVPTVSLLSSFIKSLPYE